MKTIKTKTNMSLVILFCLTLLLGCDKVDPCNFEIEAGPNAQTEIQNALNVIEEGCKIELGEGVFELTSTLTMDAKSDVRIEGKGRENTILSYEGQTSGTGGDGVLITNSSDIIVMDLTIRDTIGDALKFINSNSIVIQKVNTIWSGEPSEENGAYGIYPVLSSNILIEECYAYGASDSGIYVGQSDKAIIRDSKAEGNVIGIEIENTTSSDVYDNILTDNASGILIVSLPGLSQNGSRTRVFDNTISNNLRGNFAHPGHIAAEVPAGTGILVLSMNEVEVFDNELDENNVVGTSVASYLALSALGLAPEPDDPAYNPFPGNVYIHDNSYFRSNTYPDPAVQSDFGNYLVQSFGSNGIPDIILDGIFAPGSEPSGNICIENNSGSSFVNLNLPDFPNNTPSFEQSPHNCALEPLPAVEIEIPQI